MKNDMLRLIKALGRGHTLENYVIPGLHSALHAKTWTGGKVRVFEMEREQEYDITPHDHRYSFDCFVVQGSVVNRRYRLNKTNTVDYAKWASLLYDHTQKQLGDVPTFYYGDFADEEHAEGDWYSMRSDEFHSIRFSKGATVMLIEGPETKDFSACLFPYHKGSICNTFVWRDWMMKVA